MAGATVPSVDKALQDRQALLDLLNEQGPLGAGAAWLLDFMGLTDPNSIAAPPAAVSKFMKPKMGGKWGRMNETDLRMNELEKTLKSSKAGREYGGRVGDVAAGVSAATLGRKPRVAGHLRSVTDEILPSKKFQVSHGQLEAFPDKTGVLRLNTDKNVMGSSLSNTMETLNHELGHAAQNISLGDDFNDLYNLMDRVVGYTDNPFEVSARRIAERRLPGVTKRSIPPAPNALRRALDIIEENFQSPTPQVLSPEEVALYQRLSNRTGRNASPLVTGTPGTRLRPNGRSMPHSGDPKIPGTAAPLEYVEDAAKQALKPLDGRSREQFQRRMLDLPETLLNVRRRNIERAMRGQRDVTPRSPDQLVKMLSGMDLRKQRIYTPFSDPQPGDRLLTLIDEMTKKFGPR